MTIREWLFTPVGALAYWLFWLAATLGVMLYLGYFI